MSVADDALIRIKGATRDLVTACGGIERAGRICGFSDSTVSRWQLNKYGDVIPLMAALTLEAECQDPCVTRAMAEINGCRLGEGAPVEEAAPSLSRLHAEADLAVSEVGVLLQQALEDQLVTPTEAEIVDRGAAKAESKIREFRQGVARHKIRAVEGGR